ncbi:hypothetical protein B296_00034964, partial [Ensete ventricosum]
LPFVIALCAVPSTVKREDRRFLYHQRTPLKLPPPTTLSFVASTVVVKSFRHCYCPQLPSLLLLLSVASYATTGIIRSFLHRCCCHPQLPLSPLPSPYPLAIVSDTFLPLCYC